MKKIIDLSNKKIAEAMRNKADYIKIGDSGQEGDYIIQISKELWLQIAEIIEKSERKNNNE